MADFIKELLRTGKCEVKSPRRCLPFDKGARAIEDLRMKSTFPLFAFCLALQGIIGCTSTHHTVAKETKESSPFAASALGYSDVAKYFESSKDARGPKTSELAGQWILEGRYGKLRNGDTTRGLAGHDFSYKEPSFLKFEKKPAGWFGMRTDSDAGMTSSHRAWVKNGQVTTLNNLSIEGSTLGEAKADQAQVKLLSSNCHLVVHTADQETNSYFLFRKKECGL